MSSYTSSMDLWNDPAFLNDGGGGRVGNRVGKDPFFTEEMQTTAKKMAISIHHYFTHFKTLSGFLDDKCIFEYSTVVTLVSYFICFQFQHATTLFSCRRFKGDCHMVTSKIEKYHHPFESGKDSVGPINLQHLGRLGQTAILQRKQNHKNTTILMLLHHQMILVNLIILRWNKSIVQFSCEQISLITETPKSFSTRNHS